MHCITISLWAVFAWAASAVSETSYSRDIVAYQITFYQEPVDERLLKENEALELNSYIISLICMVITI